MDYIGFVPQYPALGYVISACSIVGLQLALTTLFSEGGSGRTRAATFLGLALSITVTALTLRKGNNLFVWHVIGMSLAVFAFQPAALHCILARRSAGAEARKSLINRHKFLQFAVTGAALAGFLAIYLNKPPGFPGKHFSSVHSMVGLTGLLLLSFNVAQAAYSQGNPLKPKLMWVSRIHRAAGTSAHLCMLAAACLGFYNRTVIVDWTTTPVRFSLPETWREMNGWATSTHGPVLAWLFIACAIFILLVVIFPGSVSAKSVKKQS